jgi:hypothetical protein
MALWRSRLKIHQFLISRVVNHAQTGRLPGDYALTVDW